MNEAPHPAGPALTHTTDRVLPTELSRARRAVARRSFEAFVSLYLQDLMSVPSSRMHAEITALLEDASTTRGARMAIAAPRGHGKSALVSQAFVLWSALFRRDPFIVIISATTEQAGNFLDWIRATLERDPLIIRDYPELAEPPPSHKQSRAWQRRTLVLRNGVRISGLGAAQAIRGLKHHQHRPSLIVLDDVEDDQAVLSRQGREKMADWLMRTVLPMGDERTSVVMVGTLLHRESLLARLVRGDEHKGWTARRYQAVERFAARADLWEIWQEVHCGSRPHNGQSGESAAQAFYREHEAQMLEGTQVLWPERESYLALMRTKLQIGRRAFAAEKQNEPVESSIAVLTEGDLSYWDDEFTSAEELMKSFPDECFCVGACDPSLGKGGDLTAVITLLCHKSSKRMYAIDATISMLRPDQITPCILEHHALRRYRKFAVEAVQFQSMLADEVTKQSRRPGGEPLKVVPVQPLTDKLTRVQSIQPLLSGRRLLLSRRHTRLIEQLLDFPGGDHDDGPDALHLGVQLALTELDRRPWTPIFIGGQ
jgi:predicted phage terminase large subunit-like protein